MAIISRFYVPDRSFNTVTRPEFTELANEVQYLKNIMDGFSPTVAWADIQNKPTTIASFGITDVYSKTEVDAQIADLMALRGVVEVETAQGGLLFRDKSTGAPIFKIHAGANKATPTISFVDPSTGALVDRLHWAGGASGFPMFQTNGGSFALGYMGQTATGVTYSAAFGEMFTVNSRTVNIGSSTNATLNSTGSMALSALSGNLNISSGGGMVQVDSGAAVDINANLGRARLLSNGGESSLVSGVASVTARGFAGQNHVQVEGAFGVGGSTLIGYTAGGTVNLVKPGAYTILEGATAGASSVSINLPPHEPDGVICRLAFSGDSTLTTVTWGPSDGQAWTPQGAPVYPPSVVRKGDVITLRYDSSNASSVNKGWTYVGISRAAPVASESDSTTGPISVPVGTNLFKLTGTSFSGQINLPSVAVDQDRLTIIFGTSGVGGFGSITWSANIHGSTSGFSSMNKGSSVTFLFDGADSVWRPVSYVI